MKKMLIGAALLLVGFASSTCFADDAYSLLWSDDFDGTTLNEKNWNKETHEPGWVNHELQEYTDSDSNIFVKDGCLVLKAIKTKKNGKDYYTSGKVNSHNRQNFLYGKVVVRAKVPRGKGLWPAIWMMPKEESKYGQWPRCGEIDIMEVLCNQPEKMYGTIHYGVPHKQDQGTVTLTGTTFADEFHDFSVEWEPGEMRFAVDGKEYFKVNDWFTASTESSDEKPYPAPFNQPFYVQLNLAVGGDWPGNPDGTTDFSKAEFLIDSVKVYQKKSYDQNVKKPVKQIPVHEIDASGNMIRNGTFNTEDLSDKTDWSFLLFGKGAAQAETKDNTLVITTKNPGEFDYSVQMVEPELSLVKGTKYKITFTAKADAKRTGIVAVTAPERNWIRYFTDTQFSLTTSWKTYTYTFSMTQKNDPYGRFEFNLGNQPSSATVYIKDVRLERVK